MTDKRIKCDCPFCHTKAEEIQLVKYADKLYLIRCPKCGVKFELGTKQEMIDKWNCR